MKNTFKMAVLCLMVAGCQQAEERLERLAGKKPPKNAIHEPIYCYKTLAQVNCYNQPRKGWESRLVGHFEPPPLAPAKAAPAKNQVQNETVSEATIYDVKVQDITKPEVSQTSVPAIRPLTR